MGGGGVEIHAEPSKIRGMDAIVRMGVSSSFTDTETCGSQAALYGVFVGETTACHTDVESLLFYLLKGKLFVLFCLRCLCMGPLGG